MPQTTTPFIAYIVINHPPNGWSEAWHLPDHDITTARATVALLAQARAMLLAADVYIEWAAVRQVVEPYIEWAAIEAQVTWLPQWGAVHSDAIGLLWRFETANGKWGNHLFRGVDGSEIEAEEWIRKPFWIAPGPYPIPPVPAAATKEELYRYVLALFRDRTCHAAEAGEDELGRMWWELTPWESAIYRKVSTRAWHSQYHRVSWEPREYEEQPGFTPCGTVVTVLSSCYEQDCTFFTAGPTQGIRYYFAKPEAAVCTLPTIFWGWRRDKEIPNGVTPGESKSVGTWGYSLGLSWGDAPALTPDGTADQFLGRTLCPWGEDPETPEIYRIPCDMPSPVPIRVNNDPQTFNNANVTWLTVDATTLSLYPLGANHVGLSAIIPPPDYVTYRELDGAPQVAGDTLIIDQATGLRLSSIFNAIEGVWEPWIFLQPAAATVSGGVNLLEQKLGAGNKIVDSLQITDDVAAGKFTFFEHALTGRTGIQIEGVFTPIGEDFQCGMLHLKEGTIYLKQQFAENIGSISLGPGIGGAALYINTGIPVPGFLGAYFKLEGSWDGVTDTRVLTLPNGMIIAFEDGAGIVPGKTGTVKIGATTKGGVVTGLGTADPVAEDEVLDMIDNAIIVDDAP